jgi:hypothetical protein
MTKEYIGYIESKNFYVSIDEKYTEEWVSQITASALREAENAFSKYLLECDATGVTIELSIGEIGEYK